MMSLRFRLILSNWRTIPLTARSICSGDTGRLRSANCIDRVILSRSKFCRLSPDLTTVSSIMKHHPFEGCKPRTTFRTSPTTANGCPVLTGAGNPSLVFPRNCKTGNALSKDLSKKLGLLNTFSDFCKSFSAQTRSQIAFANPGFILSYASKSYTSA